MGPFYDVGFPYKADGMCVVSLGFTYRFSAYAVSIVWGISKFIRLIISRVAIRFDCKEIVNFNAPMINIGQNG